jgi:hypothetical protein
MNGNNLNNGRRRASRYFENKDLEYLRDKINKLARTPRKRTAETCKKE